MNQYSDFAYIYDELINEDICYSDMAEYLLSLCGNGGLSPKLVLDLACGTGSLSLELMKRGIDTIGIDISSDMLSVARDKANKNGNENALFVCQDMREFELYGTVDAIFCMTDSLNYITDKRDIKKIFSLAYNYLNYGGFLIFDVNTIYKLREILGNNTFIYENENIYYIWQNQYDARTNKCLFTLDFFVNQPDCTYKRFAEEHIERGYDSDFLVSTLESIGFCDIKVYDGYSYKNPSKNSLKTTYCAVKKGNISNKTKNVD